MDIIPHGKRFDFVTKQKPFLFLSAGLVALSLVLVGVLGLNFGVDFRGGSEIILQFKGDVQTDEVRKAASGLGFEKPDVQSFGDEGQNQFLIRVPSSSSLDKDGAANLEATIDKEVSKIDRFTWSEDGGDNIYIRFVDKSKDHTQALTTLLASDKLKALGKFEVSRKGSDERVEYKLQLQELQGKVAQGLSEIFKDRFDPKSGVMRVETVGPRVGNQLRDKAVISLGLSLLFILIYIAFRFDIRYAPGAIVALLHDVIITIGVYAAFQIEVSLPIIAALLTIVGYSLNDTIVVFDRIRENFTLLGEKGIEDVVNISINDSLSRTLLTSVTTLLAVLALYFVGGDLVQKFALALIIGVIVGTYSSTFVASPILIAMHKWLEKRNANRPKPIMLDEDGEEIEVREDGAVV